MRILNESDIYELYSSYVDKIRATGSNQYIGQCPFHNDTKPSFAFEVIDGKYICFSSNCGVKGNASQFAEAMNHPNPKMFWTSTPSVTYTQPIKTEPIKTLRNGELKSFDTYKQNLKDNLDKIPKDKEEGRDIWDSNRIDEFGLGLTNEGNWVYGYYDINNELIGYKYHKPCSWKGNGKAKWYPSNIIAKYDPNKPIYICEGEKDALCLISMQFQAISGSGGCNTIPKDNEGIYDLKWLEDYKDITIVYDNDKSGQKGANKKANEIVKQHRHHKVKIAQWDKSLKEHYDIYDSFINSVSSKELFDAIDNTKEVKDTRVRKGFKTLNIREFMKQKYKPSEPIIDSILYANQITMISGDTGTKKSWIAMSCATSIASGLPLFDHFKTKPKKVLLVQFEMENSDVQERLDVLLNHTTNRVGNDDWFKNLEICEQDKDSQIFINNWDKIEDSVIENNMKGGVLIIDNVYTSTDKELQDNHQVTRLLQIIHRVKVKYDLSIILMGHSNKGVSIQKSLDKDQCQGGKTLINFVANVVLVDSSRISQDLNLMKIVKGGRSAKNELLNLAFKLKWDDDTCSFTKGAIIKNEALHFVSDTEKWEIKLIKFVAENDEMQRQILFDRDCFRRNMPNDYTSMSETKLSRLINKLIEWGLMARTKRNEYQLLRNNIEDFTSK